MPRLTRRIYLVLFRGYLACTPSILARQYEGSKLPVLVSTDIAVPVRLRDDKPTQNPSAHDVSADLALNRQAVVTSVLAGMLGPLLL